VSIMSPSAKGAGAKSEVIEKDKITNEITSTPRGDTSPPSTVTSCIVEWMSQSAIRRISKGRMGTIHHYKLGGSESSPCFACHWMPRPCAWYLVVPPEVVLVHSHSLALSRINVFEH